MKQTHALALQPAASDYWLAAREQFDSIITQLQSPQAQAMSRGGANCCGACSRLISMSAAPVK